MTTYKHKNTEHT